ncbi:ATP-binding cassette domain-containing protein [Archangium sp.]|uniref:ATP-binding cassette domain-containing protein n=1 Tax=Archangium sp. TaxID=1872627 RepID=UPI002D4D547F|nr:ATP-binding cassette domain-containing protein [Archangium sp.]HYO56175.1 ATP-binding cassette domain-containing protein [Archangium sp.]
MSEPLLQMSGICKNYGAVRALDHIDLSVHAGEVVALVGDNGAGKSTLIKVISGVGPCDQGAIRFEGRAVTLHQPGEAARLGIATVFQDLALCDNLDVVANLYLGRESTGSRLGAAVGWRDEIAMETRATRLLADLAVKLPSVRVPVAALSGGQRQSIAIARALLGAPRLVLLDEPTAALGVSQTEQVLNLIRRLREQNLAVIVISHNLADVFSVADRIEVLRLGCNAGTFRPSDSRHEDVVAAITGALPHHRATPPSPAAPSILRKALP